MASPAAGLNLGDIYYVLFRHKWKILFCAILGVGAAFGAKYVIKSDYYSGAKLFVRFVTAPERLPGDDSKYKTPDQRGETIMSSEIQILTSLDLSREVAQALGPDRILAALGGGNDLTAAAAVVKGGLKVSAPNRSSVISIFFEHPDPAIVQPVVREMVERYLSMHKSIHGTRGMVDDSLRQETDRLRNQLARTEDELRRAQARVGVISFADAKREIGEQMASLQAAARSAQTELSERTTTMELIAERLGAKAQNTQPDAPPPPSEVLSEYRSIVMRVEMLRRRESDLLNQFTSESTRVQEVRQLLTETVEKKSKLEEAHPGVVRAFMASAPAAAASSGSGVDLNTEAARLAGIQSRIKTITSQLDELRARAAELDEAEGTIAQLQRRRDLEEQAYRRYAASLEQLRINEALGADRVSNISVVENPTPPGRSSTQLRKVQAGAAAAGLVLGLAWAFLIELVIDRSVRRPTDIERMGRFPLFISIPKLSRKQLRTSDKNGSPLALTNVNGANGHGLDANHALRPFHETLRDRMISYFDARGLTHKPKLVAVTSIGNQVGTTATATGLAASLSETGDGNVLLVDLTPGQNTAHHFQRGKPVLGLEETLETKDQRLAVQDNLYVAVGGQSEQLSRVLPRQFTKLMPKLRASDFDYIIFDMPPVSQISITPRLAEYMDMVFMVVESEKTSRDALQRAGEMLSDAGANVGIILNKNRSYLPASLDATALN
jgi:polysaccharide biosynthesis transport protein